MWPCQFYIGPIPRGTTVATIAICEIGNRLICGNIVKSDSIAQQLFSDAQLQLTQPLLKIAGKNLLNHCATYIKTFETNIENTNQLI